MNPEFLENDELNYEMSIRKIYLDTRRKKTSALSKILVEESEGSRTPPGSCSNTDSDDEVVSCGVKLDLLRLGIEGAIKKKDWAELNRCQTRFLHIQGRARRIVPNSVFSTKTWEELQKNILDVEMLVNSLSYRTGSTVDIEMDHRESTAITEECTNTAPTGTTNQNRFTGGFDPISLNAGEVAGLPPPIVPTSSETDPNRRIDRLTELVERLSTSMVQVLESNNRTQQELARLSRSQGAVPKTSQVPVMNVPTWTMPTTAPVAQTQGAAWYQQPNQLNSQARGRDCIFGQEFENPPQVARQQTPYYVNEQVPRFNQYNRGNQQNPIINSSFINENLNQNFSNQRSNYGQNSFNGGRKPIPVHKWRIAFDGENDLNDFLSKVEMYSKFESTPDDVLMSSIGYLFSKRALSWYRVHYKEFTRWTELRAALIEEFLPSHSDFQITNQINSRFQSKNESFGEYLSAMQILFSYMSEPPNTSHQLQLIRRNMDPTYMFALSTQEITSVKQLAQVCRRLDDTKDMIQMRSKSSGVNSNPAGYPGKRVQFNELTETECDLEVAAFTSHKKNERATPNEQVSRKTPPPVIACWNCLQAGHTFNYCPQERLHLFCFTCGKHNTSRPKCPKCSPGNQHPGSQSPK